MVYTRTSNTASPFLDFHGNSLSSFLVLVLLIYLCSKRLEEAEVIISSLFSHFPWMTKVSFHTKEDVYSKAACGMEQAPRLSHVHRIGSKTIPRTSVQRVAQLTSWPGHGNSFHWKTLRGMPIPYSTERGYGQLETVSFYFLSQIIISLDSEQCCKSDNAKNTQHLCCFYSFSIKSNHQLSRGYML